MYVSRLALHDFRSYPEVTVDLTAGVTSFLGGNGQGKTNLIEAVDYLSRLNSHRVAADAPLVRVGADRAVISAVVVKDERPATLEIEINPGRANRARVNRAPLPRTRDLAGMVRTVVFSPEDLALVKGDPSERRRFLDDLLILRTPRLGGVRADYERVLKQRNSLLKGNRSVRRTGPAASGEPDTMMSTLAVWDGQLVRLGTELIGARLELLAALRPHLARSYSSVAEGASRSVAEGTYRSEILAASQRSDSAPPDAAEIARALTDQLLARRKDEIDRGLTLVGPHRDDVSFTLSHAQGDERGGAQPLPVKGYASHGESWSFALAMKLASYQLLRAEGDDPILILDDVFAELDEHRREHLARLVSGAEQVLVTAAVTDDVPEALAGRRFSVADGRVSPDGQ
ncbi:MAG: DNA replication/repair protein RecF [Nocardioides sp.]